MIVGFYVFFEGFRPKIRYYKLEKSSTLKPPLLATVLEPNLCQIHPFPVLVFAKSQRHSETSAKERPESDS